MGVGGAVGDGVGEHAVTVVVDVANVMGSRPDGWWRDRAGAAVRLHAELVRLAASGRAVPPGQTDAPDFVMVLEGAANAAAARIAAARANEPHEATETDEAGAAGAAGEVRVVQARGSGDDMIVDVLRGLPGRRIVVTADRELRERSAAVGATILGPGWLLGLLHPLSKARPRRGYRATRPVQPGGPLSLSPRRTGAPERAS
jgi:8-oxo-dGTP diphosphatase